jgi:hypothetical protein
MKKSTLVLVTVVGIAVLTKPNNQSFANFQAEWLASQLTARSRREGILGAISDRVEAAVNVVSATLTPPDFYNLLAINIAVIRYRGKPCYFIGAFNKWFALGSIDLALPDSQRH